MRDLVLGTNWVNMVGLGTVGITNKLSSSSSSTKMGSMIGAFGVAEKIANWFKMDIVNTTVILTGSGRI